MSHRDKHKPQTHHEAKKAAITARNKRDLRIKNTAELLAESEQKERERERELAEQLTRSTDADGNVVWSAKLQDVRNRLTGRKRMADDRWNRFAGTASGGGRGR